MKVNSFIKCRMRRLLLSSTATLTSAEGEWTRSGGVTILKKINLRKKKIRKTKTMRTIIVDKWSISSTSLM